MLKSPATVEALLQSLNQKAIRESYLFRKLSKIYKNGHLEFKEKRKTLEEEVTESPNLMAKYLGEVLGYESMYQPKRH